MSAADERRYRRVRFTFPALGLVSADEPRRFVERTVGIGDEGLLLVEGDPPFETAEGYVLVKVDDLWAPVDPAMIEVMGA